MLCLFIFIFALLGNSFFAYKVYNKNKEGKIELNVYGEIEYPFLNFNSFKYGLLTVFCLIGGEDWNALLYFYLNNGNGKNK